jgi:succinoglycan biosynthesis protein ExoA
MAEPLVTIILPIRNEAHYIARCLEAVLSQEFAHDKIEVFVVDGISDDGTREVVASFVARDPRVQLLDNPQKIVPTALNRGIEAARGTVIIRVDGHAVIASDYVRRCIETLDRVNADCVGGAIRTIGVTLIARVIALAQSSPFGVGNAAFRYADKAQYVDTLAFGAYRHEVFERAGLFDKELVRNQDDEFNFRLLRSGGKIWLDPAIQSDYFSRSTIRGLRRQYFEYGFWKIRVIQKHGRPASWRHLVPMVFVLALFIGVSLGAISGSMAWLLVIGLPYALASLFVSGWIAMLNGWRYFPFLPLAFGTMHLAYGFGFLVGIVRFGLVGHPTSSSPAETSV